MKYSLEAALLFLSRHSLASASFSWLLVEVEACCFQTLLTSSITFYIRIEFSSGVL